MRTLSYVFAAVGLLALGYWAMDLVSARWYQAREKRRFTDERRAAPGASSPAARPDSPATAEQPYPAAGSAVGMLAILRLAWSATVVEGAGQRELKLGPGHIPGTPLPGRGGNVAVAGHRDTFFRPLRLARTNDTITMTAHGREYLYKVASTEIVGPNEIRVLYPTGHETLTLVTCYPFGFLGAAPKRYIVHADCVNCGGAETARE